MKNAAIYCRVSTDNQEREGTSLQTQLENCLIYCQNKGYDVSYRFSEAYSGLSLERPEMDKLRELVRNEQIDIIVCYCLDRLSRDPVHGVIIIEELEKHHVMLEAVTETVDSSEVGKLISYIRGFASKLEASKIRERTMRGKRARALGGKIPGGGSSKLYGYDYLKGQGTRVISEDHAQWVRKMFEWLVYEGISSNQILFRLRAYNAPTKSGKPWGRSTVQHILTNPAYAGKTYLFTTVKGRRQFTRKQSDWIEIPNATPAIISQELFDAAQKQLRINQQNAARNRKGEYLLHGHLHCRQCGRSYYGATRTNIRNGKQYVQSYYRCKGKSRVNAPVELCRNKGWSARRLEAMVWAKLEEYLSKPELIVNELGKERRDADQLGIFQAELQQVERQLKTVDHEQHQLLQWALKGFPESQVEAENKRLNKARETLQAHKGELEGQIKASQTAIINIPKLEHTIELLRQRLKAPDFNTKRDFIESMGIKVWLDGENVDITGVIDMNLGVIVPMSSWQWH